MKIEAAHSIESAHSVASSFVPAAGDMILRQRVLAIYPTPGRCEDNCASVLKGHPRGIVTGASGVWTVYVLQRLIDDKWTDVLEDAPCRVNLST